MNLVNYFMCKLSFVRTVFSLLLLIVGGCAWADENCPTLPSKELELCNPTKDEVAEALTAPIAIINGIRTVGSPSSDNDEFFESIKDQVYSFKWNFKDEGGNTIVSGCPQNFKLTDTEAPVCGASQITAYGDGASITKNVLVSEIKNQQVSWSDNCTMADEIVFNLIENNISDSYSNGNTVTVEYTLKDKYNNVSQCRQNVKVNAQWASYPCPAIKTFTDNVNCNITQNQLISDIKSHFYNNYPVMDGLGTDMHPTETDGYVNVYKKQKDNSIVQGGSNLYESGEYSFYLRYKGSLWINPKFCAFSVVVKPNSKLTCPDFGDIIQDKTSLNNSEITVLLKNKVSDYAISLDDCTPNSNLEVVYEGDALSSPACEQVSYKISNYGSQRTCHANIVLLNCPNLPTLEKKFCNYSNDYMPQSDLVDFLNENVPSLDYCSEKITGFYETSSLKASYKNGNTQNISWKFTKNGVTKTCSQTVKIMRENYMSCPDNVITLEAEKDCKVSGSKIPEPMVNACGVYETWWGTDNTDDSRFQHSYSDLKNHMFANGEAIYWGIKWTARCSTRINVVDNSAPICLSPSLGEFSGKCSYSRSEVETKFNSLTLAQKGTDNCGIQLATIDWNYTAYSTFTPATDGSDKSYKIYYTVTDINGLTNDGYCTATLTVKGSQTTCPEAEIGVLSSDGSFSTSLPEGTDWKVESPSTVSVSGSSLKGSLPFNSLNEVKLSTEVCGQKKVCTTNIMLIKSTDPCTTK